MRDFAEQPPANLSALVSGARRQLQREQRRLDALRFALVPFEVCVAMRALDLPALVTVSVLQAMCESARLAPFHLLWALVTRVKHHHR